MNKKLNFGIVGTGMISDTHAAAIISLPDAVLYGAAGVISEQTDAFAKKYNITAYPDVESMLCDPTIDVVCICTPSGFHAENAITALRHGKHVVLEKPMALTLTDADDVHRVSTEHEKLVTVISQLRFSENIQYIKRLISENAFGKITMCSLQMKYWRDSEYFAGSPWRGTMSMDGGGALMNQGIHGVDLLLYLMGDAKLLSAVTKTAYHKIEVEDTAAAILEFENGAVGTIEASTCAYPGFERRLEILGERGHVVLKEAMIESLVVDRKAVASPNIENSSIGSAQDPKAIDYSLHARQIQNLIDAVHGKAKLVSDCIEGKRALKLIKDIYTMSKEN